MPSTAEVYSNPESPFNLSDYDRIYSEGESCDSEDFSEKRSNVLLIAGEHYNRKKLSNLNKRLREFGDLSSEHRLRITKNHIQNIHKIYVNNILSMVPNVGFRPKNEKETQDQKDAQLNKSLWTDAWQRYGLDEKRADWADAMMGISEVAVKVFFDPNSQITGRPFVFESIFGFDLIRPAECRDMRTAPWLCIRKMVNIDDGLAAFGDTEKKRAMIRGSSVDETMKVFDATKGGYRFSDKEFMLREFYFRPCAKYPEGWWAFVTKSGVVAEGPLPYGIFPIEWTACDTAPTTPRGISLVRTMRPYQVEINRCSSKIAEHHVTLGDDKVILQNGSKFSPTAAFPGVRAYGATGGAAPVVIAGRDGSQFVSHLQNTIGELYQVMNVVEDGLEKNENAQLDPYALLFKTASQKKKFQRYVKRFERFLIGISKIYLPLARKSLTDEELIQILGRDEIDNLAEVRDMGDLNYEVFIEAATDDIESQMGKQLMINHALQFVGPQMKPADIGKLLRVSPLGSYDGMFGDLTQPYDNLVNDILALDRGDRPPVHQGDEHAYMSAGLNARTRRADFKHLPAQVRMNYMSKIMLHDKFEAEKQLQIQRAKDGYIPTGGYLVVVDFYVDTGGKTQDGLPKTQRARVPYEALAWLIKQLEVQNMGQADIEKMSSSQQFGIAQQMNAMRQQGQQSA